MKRTLFATAAAVMLGAASSLPSLGGSRDGISGTKASPSLREKLNARKRGPQSIQDRLIAKAAAKRERRQARNKALGITAFYAFGGAK